jgi:hypothetical protein
MPLSLQNRIKVKYNGGEPPLLETVLHVDYLIITSAHVHLFIFRVSLSMPVSAHMGVKLGYHCLFKDQTMVCTPVGLPKWASLCFPWPQ